MRRVQQRTRPLSALLERQSATFRGHPSYPRLLARMKRTPELRRLRLGRRAYALLDSARLAPRYLENFYRSYGVPRDPFFPLFLAMKRELILRRRERFRDRSLAIAAMVDALPENARNGIVFLAKLERRFAPDCPLWRKDLYPRTKKRARELASLDLGQWIRFFSGYLELLRRTYAAEDDLRRLDGERFVACMVLGCYPDPETLRWPDAATVRARFRARSRRDHPDAGGDPRVFRVAVMARDALLS